MSFFRNESCANWWSATGIVQHSADYSVAKYTDELYCALRIPRPSALHSAVPKRQAEFLAGRYCAARVLERLDSPTAVGIGRNRSPTWPAPIVGSISHTADKAVAVAARAPEVIGLGIDVEAVLDLATAEELRSPVLRPEDEKWLRHPLLSVEMAMTLIFSAKESFFKALYPSVGEYFGFEAVSVSAIDTERGRVHLALQASLPGAHFRKGTVTVVEYRRPAAGLLATLAVIHGDRP